MLKVAAGFSAEAASTPSEPSMVRQWALPLLGLGLLGAVGAGIVQGRNRILARKAQEAAEDAAKEALRQKTLQRLEEALRPYLKRPVAG